jgi:hypothetical protein
MSALLDMLKSQGETPTAAPATAAIPPHVIAALSNPPDGMTANDVLQSHAAGNFPDPAAVTPEPVTTIPAEPVTAEPEPAPKRARKTKAKTSDEVKILIECAHGGLNIAQAREYLDLLAEVTA